VTETVASGRDRRVVLSILFLLGFALLLPVLGFFAAAALYLASHMWFLGIRSPVTLAVVCASLLGIAWALFERFLGVPLPHGVLF
jgi:hypothetical protein